MTEQNEDVEPTQPPDAELAGTDEEQDAIMAQVEQPAKVMRIGTMIKQLLEEVRAAPLDEAGRARLGDVAVVPYEAVGYLAQSESSEPVLACRHGSLTPDEMFVPLLGQRGRL